MQREEFESRKKAIVEVVAKSPYGTIIPHGEFLQISGIASKDSAAYRTLMASVKAETIRRGRAIVSVPSVGYRVLSPGEYAETAARKARYGLNSIRRGQRLLEHAPLSDMDSDDRAVYDKTLGSFGKITAVLTVSTAEIEVGARRALLASAIK